MTAFASCLASENFSSRGLDGRDVRRRERRFCGEVPVGERGREKTKRFPGVDFRMPLQGKTPNSRERTVCRILARLQMSGRVEMLLGCSTR